MSDPKDKVNAAIDSLTPEEQKILARALKQVERDLLERTVKQIRNWLMLVAGVLTVFGFVSFVSIKSTIVDQAARHLSDNTELKSDVIEKSVEKLETATKVLEKAQGLANEIDIESARISAGMATQLEEIHLMIDQVRGDLQTVAESNNKDSVN